MNKSRRNRGEHPARKFQRAGYRRPKYNIPVNIIDEETYFEAWVYCLSFKKEDINIFISDDVIYITGKRHPENDAPNFMLQEYPIKSFERTFELSHLADKSNITARQEDGILKIRVPKVKEAQADVHEVKIS